MKKIKVLVIGPDIFVPENRNGVNKTTYNLFKNHNKLDIIFVYPSQTLDIIKLEPFFSHVSLKPVISRQIKNSSFYRKLASLFSSRPFICDSKVNCQILAKQVLQLDFDVLLFMGPEQAEVLTMLPREIQKKTILIAIDSISFFYKSRIENENNFFKRLLYKLDSLKAVKFEKEIYPLTASNIFVSPYDAKWASRISKVACMDLPYGVDFEHHKNLESVEKTRDLLFTGNFDYSPNVFGALFLINEVMPLLRAKNLNVRLVLAGANPVSEIVSAKASDIVVTGFVDSLTDFLLQSSIFLSPIFFGAGVKTKVLEAMYLKCIVLGTPESFWAIQGEQGRDYIQVMDKLNPRAWADQIELILNTYKDFECVGENANKTIIEKHSWEKVRSLYYQQIEKSMTREIF